MIADLRHAFRVLLKAKGWTAVVLVSLALGIGANTALFSGVNQLLLQTISARDPETLVRISWFGDNDMARSRNEYGFGRLPNGERRSSTFSYPGFLQLQEANETLSGMFACAPMRRVNVVIDGQAEIASAFLASGSYFDVLGLTAAAGRAIGPSDDDPSAPPVVMISYPYWNRRFALDAEVVGRAVEVNNQIATIVGVTPPDYTGVQGPGREPSDFHLPLSLQPLVGGENQLEPGTLWWLQIMGRLLPGVTAEQVRGNLEGTFQGAAREAIDSYLEALPPERRSLARNQNLTAVPDLFVDSARRGIYDPNPDTRRDATLLSVVVVLVLLIVCANLANLLLARATVRQQELSIRQSMGATRRRLVRQLLTESCLMAMVGGGLGLLVALWARKLLPFGQQAPLDWRVFAFVALLSLVTAMLFSLVPALRATAGDLSSGLKESGRSVIGSRSVLSKGLLVVQVAVSIILLMGAGLFLNTLRNLRSVEVGFEPTNLLLFRLDPTLTHTGDQVPALYRQAREGLEAIPGVRSVSFSRSTFLSGSTSTSDVYLEQTADAATTEEETADGGQIAYMMTVSPGFFETLGVPMLTGRTFDLRDDEQAAQVAVVNRAAALEYWGDGSPLGRRFGFSPEERSAVEVVGVVGDVKYTEVREHAPPTVFLPYTQQGTSSMVFQLKTVTEPQAVLPSAREVVQSLAPRVPLMDISTQSEQIEGRFRQERYFAASYSAFGALAMVLAAIGLFGLASYSVAQRTHEIGVRMALGAQRSEVLRMVMSESLKLVVAGVGIGLLAVLLAGRLVTNILYDTSPADLSTMLLAATLMIAVASFAGFLPARRAARVDPMTALHHE